MYEVLVFVHIACGMIWVGGAVYAQLLTLRAQRSSDPTSLPKIAREVEFLGTRVFLPASILLFIAGLLMVAQRWSFSQLWVSVAMLLWIVSALVGSLYLGPRSKKVGELFEAEGPSSTGGRALLSKLFLVSRLELVSFAIILGLMVWKPGAVA